jgi:hypothetical protein
MKKVRYILAELLAAQKPNQRVFSGKLSGK